MSGYFIQILLIFMAYYYLVMGTSIETQTINFAQTVSRKFLEPGTAKHNNINNNISNYIMDNNDDIIPTFNG